MNPETIKNDKNNNMFLAPGSLDKKLKGDCIPDEVRKELELPQDMKGFEIDFNVVR